ncbi:Sel1 repeat protein [Legionella busanensis]|uniref:Sel1 repeat protein n=1 Tax=Legionella busanensis TaxID=190655 RepID=A0A378KBY6_9GAMM|nr:tetratricopeptide repeat protein [Legionella busanensis]STX81683.1 Sel1 repeat protein [Legionella busanensis]
MLFKDISRASFSDKYAYQEAQILNQVSLEILAGNYVNLKALTKTFDSDILKQFIKTESTLGILIQNLHTYCKSADEKDSHALFLQSLLYSFGIGCNVDYKRAIEYLDKAITLNNSYAMYSRAYLHNLGLGGDKNPPEAIRLLEQAINHGNVDAMVSLAIIYRMDEPVNYPEAIRLLEQAIKFGNVYALGNRASMHRLGQGGPVDYAKAIQLFEYAIELGEEYAMCNRAYMYQAGEGENINYPKAIRLYECALRKGYKSAQISLDYIEIDKTVSLELLDVLWEDLIDGKSFSKPTIAALSKYCIEEIINRIINSPKLPKETSFKFLKELLNSHSTHPLAKIIREEIKEESIIKKLTNYITSFFYNPTSTKPLEKRAKNLRNTAMTFFTLCNHPTSSSFNLVKDIQHAILSEVQPGIEEDIAQYQYKL